MAETCIPSLSEYRDYLWLLARLQIVSHLQIQLDPSAIVRETLLTAQRVIGRFKVIGQFKEKDEAELAAWVRTGDGEAALAGWLRRILTNTLTDAIRKLHHGDGEAAQLLEAALEESSARVESLLAVNELTPGQKASHFEQLLRLAQAVARPEEQRTTVEKHLPEIPIEPISEQSDQTNRRPLGFFTGASSVSGK
jgi:RNA polymerase sigma-70 factor (ECF subfamily)